MGGVNESWHEPYDLLGDDARDRHRAIASLMEELEAVDWYHQRIVVTGDPDLKAILTHNRDEEMEHAAMLLEWLRRRDPELSRQLETHLFAAGTPREGEDGDEDGVAPPGPGGLAIGSLRGEP